MSISLIVLFTTAIAQVLIFASTNSVSLFADIVHNFGDALTAVPLAVAFWFHSRIAEKYAGYFVVATIFFSACITIFEAVSRLLHPQAISHLGILAFAGIIGFVGNEIAATIRLRAGHALHSPALIADGNHARIDGLVSLSVVASAAFAYMGFHIADTVIGLIITFVILRITWHSYLTISRS